VSFSVEDARDGEATLEWRVHSRHLPRRPGEARISVDPLDCDVVDFAIEGQRLAADSKPRWISIDLEPEKESLSDPPANPAVERPPSPCRIELVAHRWSGDSSPSFDLLYQDRTLGTLETPPTRRNAWLPVYPFAVLADTLIVAPIVLVTVLPRLLIEDVDDFTWIPGQDVDWHRRESQDKREQREKEKQ
jgi:hypothetical protein